MNVVYEIRTMRNTPVHIFDSEARAREEQRQAERRIGTKLKLIKITKTEEELV